MEDNKSRFMSIIRMINRDGVAELVRYLENETDFFTAPASTKYHGAFEGGLLAHSLDVYDRLRYCYVNTGWEGKGITPEGEAIVALFHDVCKVNCYHKKTDKAWYTEPSYIYDDPLPLGHGEKSLYIVSKFVKLSDEEAAAIRWHMGAFDNAFRGGERALNDALRKYPLVLLLHIADMKATYFDERG